MSWTIKFHKGKEFRRLNMIRKLRKSTEWKNNKFKNSINWNKSTRSSAKQWKRIMLIRYSLNKPDLASLEKQSKHKIRSSINLYRPSKILISRKSNKNRFSSKTSWANKDRSSENTKKFIRKRKSNMNNSRKFVKTRQKRISKLKSNKINQASKSLNNQTIKLKMKNLPRKRCLKSKSAL